MNDETSRQLRRHVVHPLLHGLVGGLLGFFFFHPASILFHRFMAPTGAVSFEEVLHDAVSRDGLPIGLCFGALGFLFGVIQGLYARYAVALAARIERLSSKETLNTAYEQMFGEPARVGRVATLGPVEHEGEAAPTWVKAMPGSAGDAVGQTVWLNDADAFFSLFERHMNQSYDLTQFETAIARSTQQIETLRQQAEHRLGSDAALIFAAHLAIIKDEAFVGAVVGRIKEGESVMKALLTITNQYVDTFAGSRAPYMRDKGQDLKDIAFRVARNLTGQERSMEFTGRIVVTHDLFPSDLLQLAAGGAGGVILLSGGMSSHVSILARSLALPLVVAGGDVSGETLADTRVLIDGESGKVCINPTDEMVTAMEARRRDLRAQESVADVGAIARTRDGVPVKLQANLNLLCDLDSPQMRACEGIGLYRTEFSFVNHETIPGEDEQYELYCTAVRRAQGRPITFRTFDVGGDKNFWNIAEGRGLNPLLGLKSLRLALRHPDILSSQVRAILRATDDCRARIMFPMVTSLDEFLEARRLVNQCAAQLREAGMPCSREIELGIQLEAPSVLEIIDELCEQGDFLALGTNDFVQYLLAADRTNGEMADAYVFHHPSVLRAIKRIVDAAAKYGKRLCVCGDVAHDANYVPYLLGIGVREFSVEPIYFGSTRRILAAVDVDKAAEASLAALAEGRVSGAGSILLGAAA